MMAWVARALAPVWREIVLVAGAIIGILALLKYGERGGARSERLRQREEDQERANQIRDAVGGVDRTPRLRPEDRRGYRD